MAKNRPSFGESVSEGLQSTYSLASGTPPEITTEAKETPLKERKKQEKETMRTAGSNPYYDYHPRTGARGGKLGAPRKEQKRTQISIGCTEEEKSLYKKAADADGRKLPEFVNQAIKEYIQRHGLDKLI